MPRAPKHCGRAGCLERTAGSSYCRTHTAERQRRGNTTARGYGASHQKERDSWRPLVAAGFVDCWRCERRIEPGEPWHLGHDDHDRTVYRGPEHAACNTATSTHRKQQSHSDQARARDPSPHPDA